MERKVIFEKTRDGITYKVEYDEKPYLGGRKYRLLRHSPDGGGWSVMYVSSSFWNYGRNNRPIINFEACDRYYNECLDKLSRIFPNIGKENIEAEPKHEEPKDEAPKDEVKRTNNEIMFGVLSRLLPYKVICSLYDGCFKSVLTGLKNVDTAYFAEYDWKEDDGFVEMQFVKPYLRPMASMTDDERRHLGKLMLVDADNVKNYATNLSYSKYDGVMQYYMMEGVISYLSERRLDYGKLIERGLALEAPIGMYE